LVEVGTKYEIEARGTDTSSTGVTGAVQYGVKYEVTRANVAFRGNNAIELKTDTTYIQAPGGFTVGSAITLFSFFSQTSTGYEFFGSKGRVSIAGVGGDVEIFLTPPLRTPLTLSVGQSYSWDYQSTVETSVLGFTSAATSRSVGTDRLAAIESVTVPAGTFSACRLENQTTVTNLTPTAGAPLSSTSTNWLVASGPFKGLPIKSVSGTGNWEATRLKKGTQSTP
jgi:hypothetical protein